MSLADLLSSKWFKWLMIIVLLAIIFGGLLFFGGLVFGTITDFGTMFS